FDAVTIAFGIRNIADRLSVLKVFHDCLKPGGMLLVLELSTPEKGLMPDFYMFYFKNILPLIGRFVSKNLKAYQYLPASVMNFPGTGEFAAIMKNAGFCDVRWKKMTLGIATLYQGRKRK
ncbi:MAG: bifunctional demethylmenaquinone methyltransferase/2-methoxy-6-polyprenyl-1,4-benzoquinol methylase UbiE, partial [Deltaproteobacteria bacterium]